MLRRFTLFFLAFVCYSQTSMPYHGLTTMWAALSIRLKPNRLNHRTPMTTKGLMPGRLSKQPPWMLRIVLGTSPTSTTRQLVLKPQYLMPGLARA